MNVVDIRNLKKTFRENGEVTKALRGINLKIAEGQIYGILGPNGAGKTTLINILSTLIIPTSGKARVLGFDVVKEGAEIRKRIGVCYGGSRFHYNLNSMEILEYYGRLHGIKRKDREKKIFELVDTLDMGAFAKMRFYKLSTGMKQKVAIAKSVINDPELLFMDEPTVGLDVEIAIDIRKFLEGLVREGASIVLSSHNMYEIEALCKRISLIGNGKILKEGTVANVKKSVNFPDRIRLILNRYDGLEFLKRIPGFIKYEITDSGLFIEVKEAKDVVDDVIRAVRRRRYKILDVEMRKANLEEVFVKIIGGKNV